MPASLSVCDNMLHFIFGRKGKRGIGKQFPAVH